MYKSFLVCKSTLNLLNLFDKANSKFDLKIKEALALTLSL